MANITNIPAPRVPFIDDRTGLMAREWYRFLFNIFTLTGSGQPANYTNPPVPIVVGPSPFVYVNTTGNPADVMISGGGVSSLKFSRDNATFYNTGVFYGMFMLSPNDRLVMTYATAPVMTLIPR